MGVSTKQSLRHVESVLSALQILDRFATEPRYNVKQLIEKTGLTRNRIMRLCGTLVKQNYLVQDLASKTFSLGFQIIILSKAFEKNCNLATVARLFLKKLARDTGESASFYIQKGTNRLVLAREEGTHDIRYSVAEGARLPLHAGAGGKVILAFSSEKVKRSIIKSGKLPRFTSHTITDPRELEAELAKVRSSGYAFSQAERSPDAASIAAPVFDHENRLVGALGIAGPVSRFKDSKIIDYKRQVLEAASKLSRRLGWNTG